jgi:hypothetical protein
VVGEGGAVGVGGTQTVGVSGSGSGVKQRKALPSARPVKAGETQVGRK